MIKEQASIEPLFLSHKEDRGFSTYQYQTKTLLIGISRKDSEIHNRENSIVLNNIEQYIFKDTIAKFGFSFKISKLYLYIIEYRADIIYSFYRAFKKAEVYLNIPNVKV